MHIKITSFDGNKKHIVSPTWNAFGKGKLYYYLEDSLSYAVQKFYLRRHYPQDYSLGIKKIGSFDRFDIPIFKNEEELQKFTEFIGIEQQEPSFGKSEQNKLFFALLDKYEEFRSINSLEIIK